jgi:hypothetical protein
MALEAQGYHCGEDETRWWMFGEDTKNALMTFQVTESPPLIIMSTQVMDVIWCKAQTISLSATRWQQQWVQD